MDKAAPGCEHCECSRTHGKVRKERFSARRHLS